MSRTGHPVLPRTIDTDLDSTVLDYTNDPPTLPENASEDIQNATYTATDPEDPTGAGLTWSLAGPDATRVNADGDTVPVFVYQLTRGHRSSYLGYFFGALTTATTTTGAMATLAFEAGPDHEKPWDTNKDNVYEVTLVVTDSVGETGEYDIT